MYLACISQVVRQTSLADGSPLLPSQRPRLLFDALKAVNEALRAAGPPGAVSQRTWSACVERHNGCFLGLYRRDETGAKTIEMLRRARVVPQEAACPIDHD